MGSFDENVHFSVPPEVKPSIYRDTRSALHFRIDPRGKYLSMTPLSATEDCFLDNAFVWVAERYTRPTFRLSTDFFRLRYGKTGSLRRVVYRHG
jgi:hypothetical protein